MEMYEQDMLHRPKSPQYHSVSYFEHRLDALWRTKLIQKTQVYKHVIASVLSESYKTSLNECSHPCINE